MTDDPVKATQFKKTPWLRSWYAARQRARKFGWIFTLTKEEIHSLWERDEAYKQERPSIDRIVPSKGYTLRNCRYIELIENIRLGVLGRPSSEKQREAARKNGSKNGSKGKTVLITGNGVSLVFSSGKEAAEALGLKAASVWQVMKGRRKTIYGYSITKK